VGARAEESNVGMGHFYLPEIRLQIAAVTLADELNFTSTAERLSITQPALSKQIAELEDRLGFSVFTREQKKVELIQAGEAFVRGCKEAHALLEKAVRLAKATHDEVRPVITIGHSPYADPALVS
jgi:DNA-binding transcriptional LysR family regulator